MVQKDFSPTDYGFEWTDNWYKWDAKAGKSAAMRARNAEAKRLEARGYTVRKWSLPESLITFGGIGTGHPQIEQVVTVYMLNAYK